MKIGEPAVSVPTRPIAFGDDFLTTRMSETQLDNARRLPEGSQRRLGEAWQAEAMKLAQAPQVIAANAGLGNFRSVGAETVDAIGKLVSQEVFDTDTQVARFVDTTAALFSDFDALTSSLQSVPFVGVALGTMLSIARVVQGALTQRRPLPPQLQMDPDNDAAEVNAALRMLRTREDWTPLFLPNAGPTEDEQGGWSMVQEDGGFRFGRGEDSTGFGCAPGDLFYVARGVQARIGPSDVTIPNDSRSPRYSLVLRKGQNPASLRSRVFSLGAWYPGLAALGRSVWSMIGTADSAAMFQVDGHRLIEGWSDHHLSTARFKDAMDVWLGRAMGNGSKRWKREMIAGYLAHVGAAFHDVRTFDGRELSQAALLELALDANRRPVAQTVGMQATRAASNLVTRQYAAAMTPLNALVSKNAPALRTNDDLRTHFHKSRAQQLAAGAFDDVDLDEVPDQTLRGKLEARRSPHAPSAGAPTSFADPVTVERRQRDRRWVSLDLIPRPPSMTGLGVPEPDTKPGNGRALGVALVAAAGLGGAALVSRARQRSRR